MYMVGKWFLIVVAHRQNVVAWRADWNYEILYYFCIHIYEIGWFLKIGSTVF